MEKNQSEKGLFEGSLISCFFLEKVNGSCGCANSWITVKQLSLTLYSPSKK